MICVQFPTDARREAGYQLDKVQNGQEPSDWNMSVAHKRYQELMRGLS
jgi:phage-related protein